MKVVDNDAFFYFVLRLQFYAPLDIMTLVSLQKKKMLYDYEFHTFRYRKRVNIELRCISNGAFTSHIFFLLLMKLAVNIIDRLNMLKFLYRKKKIIILPKFPRAKILSFCISLHMNVGTEADRAGWRESGSEVMTAEVGYRDAPT